MASTHSAPMFELIFALVLGCESSQVARIKSAMSSLTWGSSHSGPFLGMSFCEWGKAVEGHNVINLQIHIGERWFLKFRINQKFYFYESEICGFQQVSIPSSGILKQCHQAYCYIEK